MAEETRACETCAYWMGFNPDTQLGKCHREPKDLKLPAVGMWPFMHLSDLCGNYEERGGSVPWETQSDGWYWCLSHPDEKNDSDLTAILEAAGFTVVDGPVSAKDLPPTFALTPVTADPRRFDDETEGQDNEASQ